MATGLSAAKSKLEKDLYDNFRDAMEKAFKETFLGYDTEIGDKMASNMAETFAKEASKTVAAAVHDYVTNAKITGTQSNVATLTAPPMGGPVTGVIQFSGTELSLT